MAEGLLRRLALKNGLPWTASSAGTQAAVGLPLSRRAATILASRGIEVPEHRASALDAASVRAADAVYAMTREHLSDILARFPEAAGKTFVLREAAGLAGSDIPDPVGKAENAYEDCAALIEEALTILIRRSSHVPNAR